MKVAAVLTQVAFLLWTAAAKESGAPDAGCASMMPKHKDPKTQADAVETTSINADYVVSGVHDATTMQVKVTLKGVGSATFQGFLIRVMDKNAKYVTGKFIVAAPTGGATAQSKAMKCDMDDDSVTHVDITAKGMVEFMWAPPTASPPAVVVVHATVVKEKQVFARILSSEIQLSAGPPAPVPPAPVPPAPVPPAPVPPAPVPPAPVPPAPVPPAPGPPAPGPPAPGPPAPPPKPPKPPPPKTPPTTAAPCGKSRARKTADAAHGGAWISYLISHVWHFVLYV
ncbi:uncharacterized protein LOC135398151 isoform X2 [Ornithodoros turicata]|uniref:uncharacterized protein LOC135398151 isoform X2 n=1 Tax=Ornithodoros turicata TaxID=34597 RepID=UPI003139EC52